MISASFFFQHSLKRVRSFQETFLFYDTSIKMILGILFLSLSNANVKFIKLIEKFIQKYYIIIEALSTITLTDLINRNEFISVVLDENFKIFLIYMSALEISTIHSSYVTEIAIW